MVRLYKEDKELNAWSNDDDSGYESENWGKPWKNYRDEKYTTDKELEIVIQKIFEENTVCDCFTDTFFTHMAVIGNSSTNGDLVSRFIDNDEFITVLFHIEQPLYDGVTNYDTGLTSDEHGTLTEHIPCQHGRLTIGSFDKIIHSVEAWEG